MAPLKDYTASALALAFVSLSGWAALAGPFPALVPLGDPTAYRSIYVHVPLSTAALLSGLLAFLFGLMYLGKKKARYFELLDRSAKAAAALSWASFVGGTAWAATSWGSAFSGDPRQLSVLAMAVLYSIYFVVKRSVEDPDRSMSISAFYATAAFASVPIVLIAPSIFPALHPATSTAVEALGAPIARLLDVSMALALSLLALYIAGARVPKPVAYLSLAIAASVAAAIGAQYLQPVYVVYGASVAGNVVVMNTSEGVLSVPLSRVDLRPLFVNGTSTLVGHLVAPNGAIVVHWSVAVNVLIAGAAVLALSVSGRHEP